MWQGALTTRRSRPGSAAVEGSEMQIGVTGLGRMVANSGVVTSRLLDLTPGALAKDEKPGSFRGEGEDPGAGRWTVEAAIEEAVPADVLVASLLTRFQSPICGERPVRDALRFPRPCQTDQEMTFL
jgi:6-phosphogluconate dehydrogenase